MEKDEQLQVILDALKAYHALSGDKATSLFLLADTEAQIVVNESRGDVRTLAQAFTHQMKNQPNFNRLMKSLMGSYLSQHPEEKKEFLLGLELTKDTPSMN